MSINRVTISGNLTRDPEVKRTQGGTAVLQMGVAVNDRRKNPQTGEWEDVPNFVDCTMFGTRAEAVSRFLSKGAKVAIEGKLRYRAWEAQDGSKRSKLEVVVDELEFMSRREDGQPAAQQRPAQAPASPYQQPAYVAPTMPAPAAYPPAAQPARQPAPQPPRPQAPQQTAMDYYDEDIPF